MGELDWLEDVYTSSIGGVVIIRGVSVSRLYTDPADPIISRDRSDIPKKTTTISLAGASKVHSRGLGVW